MAAFRKMFFAAASAAALAAIPASAQGTAFQPFNCSVTANAPLVRWQGLTEQVGDILLTCTGGTPTALGQQVPVNNFAVQIQSTNITSQLLPANLPQANGGYPYSEAVLTINEPQAASPNPAGVVAPAPYGAVQQPCVASNTGSCPNLGDGNGGSSSYSVGTNFNMFQGYQFDAHTIRFDGVPMDAPGANKTMVVRISNIRVDATPFNGGSLSGQPITASVSITGTQPVSINNILPYVVGYAANGIKVTASGDSKGICNPGQGRVTATIQEGFASSFKRRDAGSQNILGYPYFTETGFYEPALGWVHPELVGHATQGTRILVSLSNIEKTLTITAPDTVSLAGGATAAGLLGGPDGGSGYLKLVSPASFTSTKDNSTTTFEYEVMYSDPSAIETADINFAVAYTTSSMYTVPPTYILASAQLSPVSTNHNAALASSDAIPRFVASPSTPTNTFFLTGCQCDLLFPYVVSQGGIETGIAISNTSADPYGTAPQSGYVQLFYYPNHASTFVPPSSFFTTAPSSITAQTPFSQTSSTQVGAGDQLLMVVGSGATNGTGIQGAPGFSGYMIAVTGFQYCHAFAFVSDTQVQKLAEGYLAVVLDQPNVSLDNRGIGGTSTTGIAPPSAVPGEHLNN